MIATAAGAVEGVRLSPQQKRLWLLQPTDGGAVHRTRAWLWIDGPLDHKVLRQAFEELIERHEILRTSFRCLPGMTIPLQVIRPTGQVVYEECDASSWSATQRGAPAEPFDLEGGALLRLLGTTLSPHRHVYRIELPALCADARGLRCLVREAARLYERRLTGSGELEEVLQYADLAEWLNEMLEAEEAEVGRAYWRSRWAAGLPPLRFPGTNGAPAGGRFQPASVVLALSGRERNGLAALAHHFDADPGELLLAAWLAFVADLTQRSEVLMGVTFGGRGYAELESSIGLFARTLAMRCDATETLRLSDLLVEVQQALVDASHWQECFHWDLLPVAPREGEEPFFAFGFEDAEEEEGFQAGGARFSICDLSSCCDRFEVKLRSSRGPDGWSLAFDYDTARLTEADARNTVERFRALLASVVQNPEAEIGDLEILPEQERRRLLDSLRSAPAPAAGGPLVHHLFEEQAVAHPQRPALVDERRAITYGELEARSLRLARRLHRFGVRPGTVVALCLDRSLEVVVAILGTLRAGAAYAPLDPAQPRQRLAFMLEDLRAPVLIAERHRQDRLPESGAAVLFLGDEAEEEDGALDLPEPAAEDLAYVIFTSGSTGRPKGVGVEHRQLLAYLRAILGRMALPDPARFALVSTFAADLGHTVLFPALATGGCLQVISYEQASDPAALTNAFRARPIDCLKIVPGHLGALLAASPEREILPRSQLILGGEPCSWELVDRVCSLGPTCSILNHYGPTETTVGVLTHRVETKAATRQGARVPLGQSLAGTAVYLVNSRLRLVPAGAVGEICIGGRTVARGYVNRPDLTAERFLPDPFSDEPGARLYRTGDLARLLPDNSVEFLGRADHQVKIRGFRIELGEIEAAFVRIPGVREAVVLVDPEDSSVGRLVAYVVASPETRPDVQRLRQLLLEALPDPMVPAVLVFLDTLPRTANGKVDRHALPAQHRDDLHRKATASPRTEAEETVLRIWQDVLGREEIGIHDNFFELGGDSILGIQVVARANRAGLNLTPRQAFEHQTVADLAAVAGTGARIEADQGLVEGPMPLTPIQHRFFEQHLAELHHWNQSVLLAPRLRLETALLARVFERLLGHHDALRLRFRGVDGDLRQENTGADGNVPLCQIDLSVLPSDLRAQALTQGAADSQRSLDLARGPIVRAALFELGPQQGQRLLIVVHHLAIDGVSWRILLEDLETGYRSRGEGGNFGLPAKTTSFRRWAELLAEHARTEAARSELGEWGRKPSGGSARLPLDVPGAAPLPGSVRQVSVSLDVEETRELLQEVPRAYQTQIQDALLTALVRALAPWTGDRPVLVDLEGHGREEIFEQVDLSRTVGWFTTVYPVVLESAVGRSEGDVLVSIKERLRSVPGRGIGYGLLRYLGPQEVRRELASLPKPEIRFNYLGQLDEVLPESSLFKPASESRGPERSPLAPPPYLLDLLASVAGGRLRASWTYSESVHTRATVQTLAQRFLEALRSLIRSCREVQEVQEVRLTPSDFPDVSLDQAALDRLVAELGGERGS
jgi:amino acid adenylation domain-containing protein/non-ribosomal peptide synthase protein (TIGR01720 family)